MRAAIPLEDLSVSRRETLVKTWENQPN